VKKRTQLSSREWQLLSASLDGELSKKDQERADRLLSDHPAAELSIEKLRYGKTVLKLLPVRKVPRNFTVSAEEVDKSIIPALAGVLRYASAVSAALLAVVLAFDFIIPYQLLSSKQGLAQFAVETALEDKTISSLEEEAPINTWQPLAGDGSETGGEGGGIGDLDMQNEMPLSDAIIESSGEQAEEIPSISQERTTTETEQLPQADEQQSQADAEKSNQEFVSPEAESGPILGVRPSEGQEIIEQFDEISEPAEEVRGINSLRFLEIVLAGLTITAALLASSLRRRKK
jgi:hypothetical protein